MSTRFAAVLGGCLLVTAACSDPSAPGTTPKEITALPRALTPSEQGIITAANGFGFRLLARVNEETPGENIFMSPLSASMALGMVMNGTAGATQNEMRSTLGFGAMARADVMGAYRDLIGMLRGLDPHVDFRIANSIFYRDSFGPAIEPTFLSESKSYFDATTAPLDFASPAALATINGWASKATNGKIDKVLDELSADLVMVLMNAIYFKGDWRDAFDPKKTVQAPFRLEGGSTVQVPTMRRTESMRVATVGGRTLVDLGYGGDAFSMTVILPREGETVGSLVSSLDAATWSTAIAALRPSEVDLSLPRFKLKWERSLNDALKQMGMNLPFAPGEADFTRLSSTMGRNLFISFVKQNSFVDVNEVGTEAAAVTTIGIEVTSLPQRTVMKVDRPFVFVLRERLSGTILFAGKIMNPPAS